MITGENINQVGCAWDSIRRGSCSFTMNAPFTIEAPKPKRFFAA